MGALEAVVRAGEADGMAAHALRQICGEDEALRRRAVDMGAEARVSSEGESESGGSLLLEGVGRVQGP